MRLKSWLWISVFTILMASVPVFTYDRNQDRNEPPRNGREANRDYRENARGPQKDLREDERERDKEWREYLKERKKAYKEWAKANREEQKDFDKYRRDREKYRREADRDYRDRPRGREEDWSRDDRDDWDDYDEYGRDRERQYGGQYGGWGSGNEPRDGACFYTDAGYGGEHFCINGNNRQQYIGGRYNDRISSIRVLGRSRIVVYEHEGFGGARRTISSDVSNLGNFNDRISSIEVR